MTQPSDETHSFPDDPAPADAAAQDAAEPEQSQPGPDEAADQQTEADNSAL